MSARTSGTSASTDPSTGSPGATALIGKTATADAAAPSAARHPLIYSGDATYTMRPSPIQACAAEHIGQRSPDVHTVAAAVRVR